MNKSYCKHKSAQTVFLYNLDWSGSRFRLYTKIYHINHIVVGWNWPAIYSLSFRCCNWLLLCAESLFLKLTEYEQTGIDFYTNNDKKQAVLTHPNHEEYEQVVTEMTENLGNPYKQIILWIKREIYDLEGLKETIESVKTIEK